MKNIYIVLTKSNTVISRMIHFVTRDTYTHASIAFSDDMQYWYSSARKNGRTIVPAGPCREYLHSGFYKRHNRIPCAVFSLPVSDEVYEKAKYEAAKIIDNADQYHFNLIGLMLCKMNISHHRKNAYFCSQFISEILERSDALDLPKDSSLMRPIDYMHMPQLQCRFKGLVCELAEQNPVPESNV